MFHDDVFEIFCQDFEFGWGPHMCVNGCVYIHSQNPKHHVGW